LSPTYLSARDLLHTAVTVEVDSGTLATLGSLVQRLDLIELNELLIEFFDVEFLVSIVFARVRETLPACTVVFRQQLAEALVFHGLDVEAELVLSTLRTP
jgi:hypothetical protein